MNSRRDFLKKASMLAGVSAAINVLPESIQRALAIEAPAGSTYLDAEHIVFLMQENRSFDHCFGSLKGVRGFNDPRALRGPQGFPVWYQPDKDQKYYTPFRLDIENTQATWMGDLPHSWSNMVAARNNGKMDNWLEAKRPGNRKFKHIPLTMGYYDRKDIPFYYAFADAFTVCDQHFCSSLTGTSANRSYFWTGTIRENPRDPHSSAHVDNSQINYQNISWKTYPERLQEAGISWRVYQNELSLPIGFEGEEEDWLANFTDNNLEFHEQYQVKFHPAYYAYAIRRVKEIEHELTVARYASQEAYQKVLDTLERFKRDVEKYSPGEFAKLTKHQQEIHKRAFTTNTGDPSYHKLQTIQYAGKNGTEHVEVPKGDVFHQFREDVKTGKLPTVSWLVAPCRFSDHPSSPWYGAWYVSETLDILTSNPDVWKKTIFILTYDENDGYFDHIPPYVPPLTTKPEMGKVPNDINTADEYVTVEQERIRTNNKNTNLESPIGLGYRVPMVIASPWSKGGWVNSELFDLTSGLQFMEHFIEKKTGKRVIEENISSWRRLVCGNLTSVFRPIPELKKPDLTNVNRNAYVERIHQAQHKNLPGNFVAMTKAELDKIDFKQGGLGIQEKGIKPSNAIPYDPKVMIRLDDKQKQIVMEFSLEGKLPATKTIGMPFLVINYTGYKSESSDFNSWNFSVRTKEKLTYSWSYADFKNQQFHFIVHGPNGFFREFKGHVKKHFPQIAIDSNHSKGLRIKVSDLKSNAFMKDQAYSRKSIEFNRKKIKELGISLQESYGWYDYEIMLSDDKDFYYRFAGHVENGKSSMTDPLMGNDL
ncbi:phosphocholine-specific phospholipase C [Sphingobacterium kyonggiense]